MAVHLLRLPDRYAGAEPAAWASDVAIGHKARVIPVWPVSTRCAMIAVVCNPGPPGRRHTRALWVTTPEEMDQLLTHHKYRILWFVVSKQEVTDDMIERTLTGQESF
jgi:hypothetical protein